MTMRPLLLTTLTFFMGIGALNPPLSAAQTAGTLASDLLSTVQAIRLSDATNIKGDDDDTPASDTDGDGVTDDVDLCPDTPNGETVDSDGCSDSQKDSDTDGVADDIDLCPDTPIGESVDSDGCSDSQKDSDTDGVADDIDLCPNTPIGESVDSDGCSDSQKDSDTDGVADDIDLCPNTPIGESVDSDGCSASQNDPEASVKQVYEDDVDKLIVSAAGGCTSSGCHGRAGAPGGLRLYSAGEDNNITLNYESFVRYIGSNSADKLVTKISGGSGHGGGTRYRSDTAEFATIEAWAISVEALP